MGSSTPARFFYSTCLQPELRNSFLAGELFGSADYTTAFRYTAALRQICS
jgi:hypothetical protein